MNDLKTECNHYSFSDLTAGMEEMFIFQIKMEKRS